MNKRIRVTSVARLFFAIIVQITDQIKFFIISLCTKILRKPGIKNEAWRQKICLEQLRSLFCCSEHFSEKDYRKSLTGKRRDLVKNAVPSIFPWSVGNDEASERSERDKSRECQRINVSAIPSKSIENKHHSYDAPDISAKETQEEDTGEKPFEEERDLVAENYDLKQKLFLSKFGLERFGSNEDDIFFYTGFQSHRVASFVGILELY